ncbi:hypothetical protein HA49_12105 [Tatumella morbirosei]|uniref:N-acetyltransferase domain-containing protein n=1 Tax=Tatumella morbirosei TaxID=642227 RepID=A0A095T8W3_9GAMM|nr:GNAT family N-acetyltransferase [Tatumella morbirosei]KGD72949.1 hypothetical protein HA49_12105 [Tatumella morbirosei]
MSFVLRRMQPEDLPAGYRLTQMMHWPHRPEDWQQAFSLGEGVVAVVQQQIVGCALVWRWGVQRSTLGLVIVDPAHQGTGMGKAMIGALLEQVSGTSVRLHATEAGQGLYQKFGFTAHGTVHQHQCARLPVFSPPVLGAREQIRPLQAGELAQIIEFDQQAHGLYRPTLYQQLLTTEGLWVLEQQGQIEGFVCLRKFGHGYQAGPLIARNERGARQLFSHCAASLAGEFLRIDTHGDSLFSEWLTACGLAIVDTPLLMIRGVPPEKTRGGMLDFGFMTQAMG